MTDINRRGFLSGLASCVALASSRAGAATEPDLKFGVLSDVHLNRPGDEDTLLAAFTYFREKGADAVIIAGDIADSGRLPQLVRCGDCWRKVFPDNKGLDGRHVEKLFVYGNHDVCANAKTCEDAITRDVAAAWEKAFDEKYAPIWMKTVKGHTFIGAHWSHMGDFPKFLKEHAAEIDKRKPFFYAQHAHPKDTCIGAWAWGHDGGASTKALSAFPNAVAFSGHSHYSLTDERTIWQGAFTSINTSSLRYSSCDYALRENMPCNGSGYHGEQRKHAMRNISTGAGRQGMLISVFGNTLTIERRDFVKGLSLGDDWMITIPGEGDQSFAARAAKRSAPEFAAEAKLVVKAEPENVTLSFPPAQTVNKCRVFEYEVSATLIEDDVDLVLAQRRMMAPDFFLPETKAGAPGSFVFRRSELTWPGHYVFSVRPIECYGRKGAPLNSAIVVLPKYEPPKPPAPPKKDEPKK